MRSRDGTWHSSCTASLLFWVEQTGFLTDLRNRNACLPGTEQMKTRHWLTRNIQKTHCTWNFTTQGSLWQSAEWRNIRVIKLFTVLLSLGWGQFPWLIRACTVSYLNPTFTLICCMPSEQLIVCVHVLSQQNIVIRHRYCFCHWGLDNQYKLVFTLLMIVCLDVSDTQWLRPLQGPIMATYLSKYAVIFTTQPGFWTHDLQIMTVHIMSLRHLL